MLKFEDFISVKKYRDRLEIIENVISSIGDGCLKTHIMYRANLSTPQLKNYLELLERMNCIMFDSRDGLWKLTEKGRDLQLAISNFVRARNEFKNSLNQLKLFLSS